MATLEKNIGQAAGFSILNGDMPFIVAGANGAARLFQPDPSSVNGIKSPHIFQTHPGTQYPSPGPICSVRIPSGSAEDDDSFAPVVEVSIRVWLDAHALRTNGRYDQQRYQGDRLRPFGHEYGDPPNGLTILWMNG